MAKYNTFKYGSGVLYGISANANATLWSIEIDWDGDGVFDGSNEATRVTHLYCKRGRDNFLSISSGGVAKGFEPIRPGVLYVTLDDYDYKYNPYNTSSPLYGLIEPGKFIRVKTTDGITGTENFMFYGIISDIRPTGGTERKVIIRAEDGLKFLGSSDASVTLQTGITVDDAISSVLTDSNWPATQWPLSLETVNTELLPYWWAEGKSLKEIGTLSDSGLGIFFHAADGTARYYTRYHYEVPTTTITSADVLKDVSLPLPWEVQRNKIKISIHPRKLQTVSDLWTSYRTITVTPGATVEVWGAYIYNNETPVPATNVISPVATTDYLMNSNIAGTGVNLTSSLSVAITDFGTTAKFLLTNNHATQTGYVTLLKVRGQAFASQSTDQSISQTGQADKILAMELDWVQSVEVSNDFSAFLLDWLSGYQKFPTIILQGRKDLQYNFDLQDTVTLQLDALQVDENFRIGMIEHRWNNMNGQDVETKISFEPVAIYNPANFWTFSTNIGTTSIFGY